MSRNLNLEVEALRGLADLLEQADKVRCLFEQAGTPLPDALQRLIRSNGHAPQSAVITSFRQAAPPDAAPDWIWIEVKDATPGTLAFAVLRGSAVPLTVRELHARVQTVRPEVSVGTVANTITRAVENKLVHRTDDGHCSLLQIEKAGVMYEGHIWGPPTAFQSYELASYRRKAIMHVLRQNPVGLLQSQILDQLRKSDLVRPPIPLDKSLIKADVEAMDTKQIRRRGGSKKWEVIQ